MSALPPSARSSPSRIRSVELLPAPFGPRKPVTRPGRTLNDTSSTTERPRCFFTSLLISITAPASRAATPVSIGRVSTTSACGMGGVSELVCWYSDAIFCPEYEGSGRGCQGHSRVHLGDEYRVSRTSSAAQVCPGRQSTTGPASILTPGRDQTRTQRRRAAPGSAPAASSAGGSRRSVRSRG